MGGLVVFWFWLCTKEVCKKVKVVIIIIVKYKVKVNLLIGRNTLNLETHM